MSNYDRLLEEAKKQGANLAKNYVPELYKILVEEEKLDPKDAGDRVKKDLALIWSITTINKNLPDEAKHTEKDHSNSVIEDSVKPVSQIVIKQSSSGQSTDPDDEFGRGVVPMTNDEPVTERVTVSPNNDQYNVRMVMSAGKFIGLIKGMTQKVKEKAGSVDYAIEYDAKEKALYIDFAEPGEARNIDD